MESLPTLLFLPLCLLLSCGLLAVFARRKSSDRLFAAVLLVAAVLGLIASFYGWQSDTQWTVPAPLRIGVAPFAFRIDALASVFLTSLSLVTAAVAIYIPVYLEHLEDGVGRACIWSSLFLFVLSMGAVLLAANAPTFIVFWETMALSSAVLVASQFKKLRSARAALIYLGSTRLATAALAVGFIFMYTKTGEWSFSRWDLSGIDFTVGAVLIFLGLAIKAGLWPFHVWLPHAHPAAPAPVSALMSGVMIKVAIYAMIRLFFLHSTASLLIAVLLLVLGLVSAVWGIVFAIVETDLKRILAYSSIENIGIICVALASSLLCQLQGWQDLATFSLAAALFHVFNHSLIKSLLFLGAGVVDSHVHTMDLDLMGGLWSRLPWTAFSFTIGVAALCALPPLNGFASKWLVYKVFFDAACRAGHGEIALISILTIGILCLVGGLSLACFANVVGQIFCGRPRFSASKEPTRERRAVLIAQFGLAISCVIIGATSPWVGKFFSHPVAAESVASVPSLPLHWIAISLLALTAIFLSILNAAKIPPRKYDTWECGFGGLDSRMQISSESFVQPIATVFGPLLRYRLRSHISGRDRRHFPEEIRGEVTTQSILESRVYGPIVSFVRSLSEHLAKLQAGSIHLYLLYLLLTVIVLLVWSSTI